MQKIVVGFQNWKDKIGPKHAQYNRGIPKQAGQISPKASKFNADILRA